LEPTKDAIVTNNPSPPLRLSRSRGRERERDLDQLRRPTLLFSLAQEREKGKRERGLVVRKAFLPSFLPWIMCMGFE
jgi:hypothetical protein